MEKIDISLEIMDAREMDRRDNFFVITFLFLLQNIPCGCSFESPFQGDSNEHQQCMFSLGNKEVIVIFRMSYLFFLLSRY